MIAFEKYLIGKGYDVTHKVGLKEFKGYSSPSTMNNLINIYRKDGKEFICGLYEYKMPPTIVFDFLVRDGGFYKYASRRHKDRYIQAHTNEHIESNIVNCFITEVETEWDEEEEQLNEEGTTI